MAYREFAASAREADSEPVAFSLGGERFECLPAGTTLVTAALFHVGYNDLNERTATQFVAAVLADGEERRFHEVLARRSDPVSDETLLHLTAWLVEVYTGRPTSRSNGSPAGPSAAGPTSTEPAPTGGLS